MTRREPFCPPDFVDPKPSVRRADSLDCQSSSLVSYSSHSRTVPRPYNSWLSVP